MTRRDSQPAEPPPCPKCDGTGHKVNAAGYAERCPCIDAKLRGAAYGLAGVPPAFATTDRAAFARLVASVAPAAAFDAEARAALAARRPLLVTAQMPDAGRPRLLIAAVALRAAIDLGGSARCARLLSVVSDWFDRAEQTRWRDESRTLDAMVIEAENPMGNRMAATVLQDLLAARVRAERPLTVLLSSDPVHSMPGRYGVETAAIVRASFRPIASRNRPRDNP